ncbi:unnamed protein product [Lactuca virosa]|uniref:Uncharacterized protein n=1 Tax=Lactuca virosa TaxID=75947 RepID=A0AAU9LPA5_9ASTR|nr:unnamed protein product [Lactuca virosa]
MKVEVLLLEHWNPCSKSVLGRNTPLFRFVCVPETNNGTARTEEEADVAPSASNDIAEAEKLVPPWHPRWKCECENNILIAPKCGKFLVSYEGHHLDI